jgi:hypothetical protein
LLVKRLILRVSKIVEKQDGKPSGSKGWEFEVIQALQQKDK